MRRISQLPLLLFRVLGLATVVLGLLRWSGLTTTNLWLHIGLGLAFSLVLTLLSGLAFAVGVHRGLATLGLSWALILPIVGFGQTHWWPGDKHVFVQVIHLLVGLAAFAIAERIAAAQRKLAAHDVGPLA